ncbi:MAG: hypothetical protein ABL903_13185 [Methylococcales bacterium]
MNAKNSKTKQSIAEPTKTKVGTESSLIKDTLKAAEPKKTVSTKKAAISKEKTTEPITAETEKSLKSKKKHPAKVIRDSFSFPEIDYLKILQIKALCLSEGVHVKKGEVLRAGLDLLTQLSQDELKEVIGKVERVKTGRPLAVK